MKSLAGSKHTFQTMFSFPSTVLMINIFQHKLRIPSFMIMELTSNVNKLRCWADLFRWGNSRNEIHRT